MSAGKLHEVVEKLVERAVRRVRALNPQGSWNGLSQVDPLVDTGYRGVNLAVVVATGTFATQKARYPKFTFNFQVHALAAFAAP